MNPESNGVRTWQWVVTVIVIIILIVLGYYMFKGNSGSVNPIDVGTSNTPGTTATDTRITVTDQFPGNIVYISSAQLAQPGFVVIQKDNNGQPGAVIGSQWFDKGINPGKITLTENTKEGGIYYAVVYSDTDNNKIFDPKVDMPLKDASGNIIMRPFRASSSVTEIKG